VPFAILSDRAVLDVSGTDAASFLNGLLTNDVLSLKPRDACYAGLLSAQGKALFDLFVWRFDGGFLLDVAAHRAADLLKKLTMYKLRAAVTLSPRPEYAVIAGWGDVPPPHYAWPDPRIPAMGWRWITSPSPLEVEGRGEGDTVANYHAHRISQGVPDSSDIGTDQLLWLETNADMLHGVSFTKGCYVGQENTARMHHRGKVRKRIVRVTSTEGLPESGTIIFADDKQAGQLLSVMGDQGLALLRMEYVETGAALMAAGEPVRVDVTTLEFTPTSA
jgi:folate-binding protein YgfZ